ncbi:MAG: hypothetical protein ABJA02_09080 [Acidobacteriota bacterium]
MERIAAIRSHLGDEWIPTIYRDKVRTQRTRSTHIDIPPRQNLAEIQYTLLGIELKVGKNRFSCPDLAAARYIRIFARAGISDFAIPYDITKVSVMADELETAWQKLLLLVEADSGKLSAGGRTRFRKDAIQLVRLEIAEIGAGGTMPTFDRETRQRPR